MSSENRFKKIPVGKFCMSSKCYNCAGTGYAVCPVCSGNQVWEGKTCNYCKGKGVIDCPACKGRGVL